MRLPNKKQSNLLSKQLWNDLAMFTADKNKTAPKLWDALPDSSENKKRLMRSVRKVIRHWEKIRLTGVYSKANKVQHEKQTKNN